MLKKVLAVFIAVQMMIIVLVLALAGILAVNTEDAFGPGSGTEPSFGPGSPMLIQGALEIPKEAEEGIMGIFNSIIDGVKRIGSAIFDLILAPINAIVTLIENWTGSLSSWYAPIIAVLVIMFVVFVFRFWSAVDALLDKINI